MEDKKWTRLEEMTLTEEVVRIQLEEGENIDVELRKMGRVSHREAVG